MFRPIRLLLAAVFTVFAMSAAAIDLQGAKDQGLVGEQRDGYLGIVSAQSADVSRLVTEVNTARRSQYQKIARDNQIDVGQVERLAAEKAISKTRPGHYVQAADGSWVRK